MQATPAEREEYLATPRRQSEVARYYEWQLQRELKKPLDKQNAFLLKAFTQGAELARSRLKWLRKHL